VCRRHVAGPLIGDGREGFRRRFERLDKCGDVRSCTRLVTGMTCPNGHGERTNPVSEAATRRSNA
jgi:hypothetical protein